MARRVQGGLALVFNTQPAANPQFSQKIKLINHFPKLAADHLVLDLGAGTSFNVLDFFLAADRKLVVLTPEPTAIQNAYVFIRNAVYRKLSRPVSKDLLLKVVVKNAMDPKNAHNIQTIQDLMKFVETSRGLDAVAPLEEGIHQLQPALITNMVMSSKQNPALFPFYLLFKAPNAAKQPCLCKSSTCEKPTFLSNDI